MALDGTSEVTTAGGLTMLKVSELDTPPPGAGLNTVTGTAPTFARSSARIVAVNWLLVPNVVVRGDTFHNTDEPAMKFVPLTVNVKPGLPAVAAEMPSDVSVGMGFVIVTETELELPPP